MLLPMETICSHGQLCIFTAIDSIADSEKVLIKYDLDKLLDPHLPHEMTLTEDVNVRCMIFLVRLTVVMRSLRVGHN